MKSWRSAIWVLPAIVPVVIVLGAGLGSALVQSLGLMPLVGSPVLTLDAYSAQAGDIATSAALSVAIAAAATTIGVIVGVGLALTAVAGRRAALWAGTVTVPVPHLIGAATMGLLLADSGLLARLFGLSEGGVAGPGRGPMVDCGGPRIRLEGVRVHRVGGGGGADDPGRRL